jgi:tetratricopeptide (TPR) repeat protein
LKKNQFPFPTGLIRNERYCKTHFCRNTETQQEILKIMFSNTQSSSQPEGKSNMVAQSYNNKAASCIDDGRYDHAIRYLAKAFQLTSHSANGMQSPPTNCGRHSLQACLRYSRSSLSSQDLKRQLSSDKMDSSEGFIHRVPLRISPNSIDTPMGSLFSFILTYNMALAHHLSAVGENKESQRRRKLQKALKLYELSYRWHVQEEMNCLAFSMIIANNLSEIHRVANNERKRQMCLQNLLSTMMYVHMVDYHHGEVGEMDGFVHNTSPLILKGQCAGAA